MIIRLQNGAWEKRESCGCSSIFEATRETVFQCQGHKTHPIGWYERTLTEPEPLPLPYTHEQMLGGVTVSLSHLVGEAISLLTNFVYEGETLTALRALATPTSLMGWADLYRFANSKANLFRSRIHHCLEADKLRTRDVALALRKVAEWVEHMLEAYEARMSVEDRMTWLSAGGSRS